MTIDASAYTLLLQAAAAVTAATVVVSALYRWVVVPLKAIAREAREAWETLRIVREDLRPNGGSSIRDAIDRIERGVCFSQGTEHVIAQALGLAMWRSDATGACTWASTVLCEMFHSTPEEMLSTGWINGILEADREQVMTAWALAVQEKRRYDNTYRLTDGTRVHAASTRVTSAAGAVIGYIGVVRRLSVSGAPVCLSVGECPIAATAPGPQPSKKEATR